MGFYIHLLIVHPNKNTAKKKNIGSRGGNQSKQEETPSKEYTLWKIESLLAVGRVTRMEKLTAQRFAHMRDQFPSQERAGICLIDSIFPKLTKPLNQPKKSSFAPRFTVDEGGETAYAWREQNLTFDRLQGAKNL